MSVDYQSLNSQLAALLADEQDALANSANFVALLYAGIPDINWLGIYVLRNQELVLGPFQGLAACVRIPLGQGACGTAAQRNETLRVDNVNDFTGHIVCDPASKSEIVVPLSIHGELIGVLDIDSPKPSRFGASDQLGVEILCKTFMQNLQQGPGNFI
jgi:GAF domain-containing protein